MQGNSSEKQGQHNRMVSEHIITAEPLDNNNPFDSRKTKGDRDTLMSTKSGPQMLMDNNDLVEEERL